MNKNIILFFSIYMSFYYVGITQNKRKSTYTLNDCIELAIHNNLNLKSFELNSKTSKINYIQSRLEMLPVLNANYSLGVNNGRSIDPSSNDYINQELTFSNARLSLNATVFNGFRLMNSIKQNRFDMQAAEMEMEEVKQNLILEVTFQYLQILNLRDLIKLSESRMKTTKKQLERLKTHYDENAGNPVDYTDMQGQYTKDQMNLEEDKNNLKSSISEFAKLLDLDSSAEKSFEDILGPVGSKKYPYKVDVIYNEALKNLATFKSRQLKIEAAEAGIKVAKSNYFPEVSVFGQLNTNYSSAAQVFTEIGMVIKETGDFVNISNQELPVLRNETQLEGHEISYENQFKNNLNSIVGVAVNIPLLNGFRSKNSVSIQKIEKEEALIALEQTKLLFKQSIEQAYNNMESTFNKYHILLKQVKAYEESFRVNEIRFNSGVSNIVDYITSKNNMDSARLNLNSTKYEYLLRVKVLDYYRGILNN